MPDLKDPIPEGHGHAPDQHTPGAKLDHDKIDMSLLQFLPNALLEICRVMDYGQTKYSRGGFLEVDDAINRYTAAMWRHYLEECKGEKFDQGDPFYDTPEGLPFKGTLRHDAQLAINALFRLEYRLREEYLEEDTEAMLKQFYDAATEVDNGPEERF